MRILAIGLLLLSLIPNAQGKPQGEKKVEFHGYNDCIQLENRNTRVILSGACGGRVLDYSLNGVNVLALKPVQAGWTYVPGMPTIDPYGGRMDIGPGDALSKHLDLWVGRWTIERTGPLSARMTSVKDKATGIQLVRDFRLASNSTTLTVTQTMKNVSSKTVRVFHWGRTFAPSGGIAIVPIRAGGTLPLGYSMLEGNDRINLRPKDKRLVSLGDTLVITGVPKYPKIWASSNGALAYITPQNLLFTKKFAVYNDRIYGDTLPMNSCIYHTKNMCEIEPMGPQERLEPGESASFTETWTLKEYPFPSGRDLDFGKLRSLVW